MDDAKPDTPELLIGALALDRAAKAWGVSAPAAGFEELAETIGREAVELLEEWSKRSR
jgi:hypothetical protein